MTPFTYSLLDPFFKKSVNDCSFSSKLQQMSYLIKNNEVICLFFLYPNLL